MRTIFLFTMIILFSSVSFSQDLISFKTGSRREVTIVEVTQTVVRYKLFNDQGGRIYFSYKDDVAGILYQDGKIVTFDSPKEHKNENIEIEYRPEEVRPAPQQRSNTSQQRSASPKQRYDIEQQTPQQRNYQPVDSYDKEGYYKTANPYRPYRKGYIGLGIGAAIPLTNEIKDARFTTGAQVNINFGYLFSENIGINASFFSVSFLNSYFSNLQLGVAGLLAGPLISAPLNESRTIEFDFRPTIGYGTPSMSVDNSTITNVNETGFAIGIGSSLRFNLSSRFAISANLDYYNTFVKDLNIASFGVNVGFNFRF